MIFTIFVVNNITAICSYFRDLLKLFTQNIKVLSYLAVNSLVISFTDVLTWIWRINPAEHLTISNHCPVDCTKQCHGKTRGGVKSTDLFSSLIKHTSSPVTAYISITRMTVIFIINYCCNVFPQLACYVSYHLLQQFTPYFNNIIITLKYEVAISHRL